MSTNDTVQNVIKAIEDRLTEHAADLGGLTGVDRFEQHPSVPARRGELPRAYVLPLVDGRYSAEWFIGDSGRHHGEFPVAVALYYQMPDVAESQETVMKHAFDCLDLFSGKSGSSKVGPGYTTGGNVTIGVWTSNNLIVHVALTRFTITTRPPV